MDKPPSPNGGCVFCDIIRGDTPSKVIHRAENLLIIQDINPCAPVHLLIIPMAHLTSFEHLAPIHTKTMGEIFTIADQMASKVGIKDGGYRLVFNQGRNAGQMVDHAHIHMLGGHKLGALG